MNKIFIRHLKTQGIVGIYPHERTQAQPLLINVELRLADDSAAFHSDDISDTVDYDALVLLIETTIESTQFLLLEKLADHLCVCIFKRFAVSSITLQINKIGLFPNVEAVGIEIERFRMASA
jgi:dihydroneopterin aldolase